MKTVKVLLLLLFVSCTAIESVEIVDGKYQKAYFAGGCFWCMEPPFEALEGVVEATSGYMGGSVENPTYEEVTTGETCLLYTSPSPRDLSTSRMPSSA